MTTFSRIAFMEPTVEIEVEPRPLRVASLPERYDPSPPPPAPAGPTQPFAGARQDGRLDAALHDPRAVTWSQRFATPLRPDARPHSVLQHGDAVLVQASVWQLFGVDGRARRAGKAGPSPLVVSPGEGSFGYVNTDGYLVAASLTTGRAEWSLGLHLSDGAAYPFLGRRGGRVVVVGGEYDSNPEAQPKQRPRLAVEVIEIDGPVDVSPGGLLRSAKNPVALATTLAGDVFAAMDDARVVLAWRDRVLTTGFDLAVRQLIGGAFEPRAVSLGDAGRVYLIVRTADGPQLWMLNAEGEQVFAAALPEEAGAATVPPLVAPDQRVFVVTEKRVIGFAPDGEFLWEFVPPRGRPYAAVTRDGWLLVAVEQSIGVLDGYGRGVSIYAAPGDEAFCTAPVLTPGGDIFVATERTLVGLQFEEIGSRTIVR
jgi:outer membrane protein assembly factor BamB